MRKLVLKSVLLLLGILELALLISPVSVHQDTAFRNWTGNPTQQNKALMLQEAEWVHREMRKLQYMKFSALAANGICMLWIWRKVRNSKRVDVAPKSA